MVKISSQFKMEMKFSDGIAFFFFFFYLTRVRTTGITDPLARSFSIIFFNPTTCIHIYLAYFTAE